MSNSRLLRRLIAALLMWVALTASCAPQPLMVTREPVELELLAAGACQPWATRAAQAYEEGRPWMTVEARVFNNMLVGEMLREGGADVAMLSWLSAEEAESGEPFWTDVFARDGVAVIVHPDSTLTQVGLIQLRDLFLGRLQEWQGMALTVVSREGGSGTRAAFENTVLGGESATLNAVVVPSAQAMVDYVAGTPGAIGYVSTERLGPGVRVLPVEGVLPSGETIADGRYPLWRPLYLASPGEPAGETREFAQWLLSGGIE